MTDDRDKLDDETRELIDRVDEQLGSAGVDEDPNPQGSRGEDDGADPFEYNEEVTPADDDPEPESDSEPETDPESESGGGASAGVAALIVWSIKVVLKFPMAVLSKMPKRTAIYQKMIKAGYQAMQKNTDAHVIVNTIYGDREVHAQPAEIDDEENKVKTVNGEEWTLPDGIQTYHVGDARIMWGVKDAHELVSPVGARTAEKIDLDDAVYVQQQRRQQQSQMAGASPQGAIADGGMTPSGLNAKSMGVWDGEPFEDVLVNWANTNPDADGMIVSLEKHYELQHSQAGAEEMKKQEDRGRLAERFEGGRKQGLIYVALLIGGLAIGLFAPGLAGSLGGGGGGGSSISLSMAHTAGALMGVM